MKQYKTETVPTNTLREGDLIIAHGGLFRVIQVKVAAPRQDDQIEVRGACHVNYCEFLGDAYEDQKCVIPEHWRDGRPPEYGRPEMDNYWNQQGNGLARTCRVIEILELAHEEK